MQVLDNPLVLSKILSFMCIEDSTKVYHISSLKSLINDCIFEKKVAKQQAFYLEVSSLTELFIKSKAEDCIPMQKRLLDRLFDHHVVNKWFVNAPLFEKYSLAIKEQLFILVEHGAYSHEALYYLEKLYSIT